MEQTEIEIKEDKDRIILIIPRKGNVFIVGLTGLWCAMLLYSLYLQISDGVIGDTYGYMLFFFIVGLFVFKSFLWNIRGKEKITLDNKTLKVERLGTILTTARKFETSLIDGFDTSVSDNPWWSKAYGFSGGQISFNYWDRPEYFGQTVTKKQALEVASILNGRIKNYAQQNV